MSLNNSCISFFLTYVYQQSSCKQLWLSWLSDANTVPSETFISHRWHYYFPPGSDFYDKEQKVNVGMMVFWLHLLMLAERSQHQQPSTGSWLWRWHHRVCGNSNSVSATYCYTASLMSWLWLQLICYSSCWCVQWLVDLRSKHTSLETVFFTPLW